MYIFAFKEIIFIHMSTALNMLYYLPTQKRKSKYMSSIKNKMIDRLIN